MCGIVGYIGNEQATSFLLQGLLKLEYRGYDSAGIAILENGKISLDKRKGRLSALEESLSANSLSGTIGIGHTRWATHGGPSDRNSHPHLSNDGKISVVHNGIIENYLELREYLINNGFVFKSETDTEVIPNLIQYYYNGDIFEAVVNATKILKGSFAIGVISEYDEKIISVRKDSPLVVGVGKGENFIASDIPALLAYTREIYLLEDNEFAILEKDCIKLVDENGKALNKEIFHVTWDINSAEKNGYPSFMMKEIYEQPKALVNTMSSRVLLDKGVFFDGFNLSKEEILGIDRICIVACGTAYHAGLVGKVVIEKLARIPVEIDIASEFRYKNPILTSKSLVIVLSQSGETADTLAVLRNAKSIGAKVLSITNVVQSSVAREGDYVIYTNAGPEIAVASTKAYTTQVMVMDLLGIYLARKLGRISNGEEKAYLEEALLIPKMIEKILLDTTSIKEVAKEIYSEKDIFYLGRGLDYALAMEASLKLKEISYIHSEAYAGGELKHGTIALIEEGTKVIALITTNEFKDKMISNIVEVKARGAKVFGVTVEDEINGVIDKNIKMEKVSDIFSPILGVIYMQLLAYFVAEMRGCNVDKPRNLAKSVTVE